MLSQSKTDADGNTVMRRAQRRSKDTSRPPALQLERVLGFTATRNTGLSLHPSKDILVYTAGCTAVFFDWKKKVQGPFLLASPTTVSSDLCSSITSSPTSTLGPNSVSNAATSLASQNSISVRSGIIAPKAIVSTAFSPDGKYLAVGEAGRLPRVLVWDLEQGKYISELKGHKFGVLALAFSPDLKHLVSLGYQHDGVLNVWNWRTATRVASNRITSKVNALAFSSDGTFCVTVGLRHIKFWYFDHSRPPGPKPVLMTKVLDGRSGVLGNLKTKNFLDVVCSDVDRSVYAITSDGHLCMLSEARKVEKFIDLKAKTAICLAYNKGKLVCGCSDGTTRVFLASTMKYLYTLPKPHVLGENTAQASSESTEDSLQYPDTIAVRLNSRYVITMYSDRSLYIWDMADSKQIEKVYSTFYHSDSVWESDFYPTQSTPQLATCSSDGTIRFWDLDNENPNNGFEPSKVLYVEEDSALRYQRPAIMPTEMAADTPSAPHTTTSSTQGVRCLKFTDDGRYLVSGDRRGNLRIYNTRDFQLVTYQEAHDAEILALDVFNLDGDDPGYTIASASRDRLIHVFSLTPSNFRLVQTIDDHSSSITGVCFFDKGQRLISCGADKSVIFRSSIERVGLPYYAHNFNHCGRATFYSMAPDYTNGTLTAVAQDKRIHQFCAETGKSTNIIKPEDLGVDVSMTRVALDASGQFACVAGSDKGVRLIDLVSNTLLGTVKGHSELVTSVRFSPDCSRVISTSGDGCIFIWRVLPALATQMRNKLLKLTRPIATSSRPRTNSTSVMPTSSKGRWDRSVGECGIAVFGSAVASCPESIHRQPTRFLSDPLAQASDSCCSDSDSQMEDSQFLLDTPTNQTLEQLNEIILANTEPEDRGDEISSSSPSDRSDRSGLLNISDEEPGDASDREDRLLESKLEAYLHQPIPEAQEASRMRRSLTAKFKAFAIIQKRLRKGIPLMFPTPASPAVSPPTSPKSKPNDAGFSPGIRRSRSSLNLGLSPQSIPSGVSMTSPRPLSTNISALFGVEPHLSKLIPPPPEGPTEEALVALRTKDIDTHSLSSNTASKVAKMKKKLQTTQILVSELCESYAELGLEHAEEEDQVQLRESMKGLHAQMAQVVSTPPQAGSTQMSQELFQDLLQKYSDMLVHTVKEKLNHGAST
ncbi:hypothetical protein DSO57_1034626 [Entomophthora muscae]|uniref:Uncharacterized protein n=1 Tax=Entomophthora muscae TaxID=34485 RepID=A0ACC2UAK1_9FUNG|nr:hypothetical protein DSO57_1034626 [Entomophthora muscae]